MKEEERHLTKLLSLLLQYPDEDLLASLEGHEKTVLEHIGPERAKKCEEFMGYLTQTPLIGLQEEYIETFDFNPNTCLNLSYHKYGDGRERGSAMASLHQIYREGGYEPLTGELPDYFPLVLEFLSVCRKEICFRIWEAYYEQIATLACRLREKDSPYASLFDAVLDIFGDSNGGTHTQPGG